MCWGSQWAAAAPGEETYLALAAAAPEDVLGGRNLPGFFLAAIECLHLVPSLGAFTWCLRRNVASSRRRRRCVVVEPSSSRRPPSSRVGLDVNPEMSTQFSTQPAPRRRRAAVVAASWSRRRAVVVAASSSRVEPPSSSRRRRAAVVAASSSQSQCRPFLAPRCTPGVVSAPAPAVAHCRGCPPAHSPAVVAALAASPCHRRRVVVVPAAPVVRVRRSSSSRTPQSPLLVRASSPPPLLPSSVVVVVVVATVTSPSPSSPPSSSSTLSVTGRAISVLGRCRSRYRSPVLSSCHRRPPPVAAVVVVDLSSPVVVLSHPAAGIADLGLGSSSSSGRGCARRRVVVVVVVGSCARRRRLAVFRWRGTPGAKHEGHPPALPIPRFCSEHQNNVNQTSALAAAAASALTTSRLCWTAAAVPEPTPRRTGRSRLPVPQLSVPTEIGNSGTMTTSLAQHAQAFQGSVLKAKVL